jgi:type II secretory pathway pseudopilin PulG
MFKNSKLNIQSKFKIKNSKLMKSEKINNNKIGKNGFTLIGILMVVLIIAALGYGSSFFFRQNKNDVLIKQNVDKQLQEIQQKNDVMNTSLANAINEGGSDNKNSAKGVKPKNTNIVQILDSENKQKKIYRDMSQGFEFQFPSGYTYNQEKNSLEKNNSSILIYSPDYGRGIENLTLVNKIKKNIGKTDQYFEYNIYSWNDSFEIISKPKDFYRYVIASYGNGNDKLSISFETEYKSEKDSSLVALNEIISTFKFVN